MQQYKTVVLT